MNLARIIIVSLCCFASRAGHGADPPTVIYQVPGLEQPAEIRVDEWGIPHIYAKTHYDVFFVQGFNAARDRLWQIDTWRRRGLGELSAVLGAAYVAQDRAARLFLYRGDMYREWLAYGSDAKRIAGAFVAGINAFVDLTRSEPALLPPEFEMLGYQPAYWAAEDVVRIRSNGLWRNLTTEVERAAILCHFPASVASLHKRLEPAWDVIVLSIGHNERIAFGLTIFPIDQEDLYVYETRPGSPNEYRYRDRWEPMSIIEEPVAVHDAAAQSVTLKFTRHGPVIFEDVLNHRAFAARVGWLEPGMAQYFGSVEYMRAQNWREFVGALNRWGAPGENQVYADIDGNIGYKPVGLFPRRTHWDGLLPVPGDGRYEWDGYFDMDALPEEFNPTRGYIATANAMNLPTDYPIATRRIGFEWSAPWRARRITEVLDQQPQHSLSDSLALPRDYTSLVARELVARLPESDRSPAA
ncbi:MAG: penicillin acylase family protein, partial [Proteobacteria bacterium]|nr:penicillin acylase family protein [Pseudomonadota bacterium]